MSQVLLSSATLMDGTVPPLAKGGDRVRRRSLAVLCTLAFVLTATQASAQEVKGPEAILLRKVQFDQKLNAQLPLETPLRDETGKSVTLGDYFGKRPVVLLFGYYECPMLCSIQLNSLVRNLKAISMSVGNEYDVVMVSINPAETSALAAAKKAGYVKRYDRPGSENGWHFLTGDGPPVKHLAGVAGFTYERDPRSGEYAHPAGIMIITPSGRISRYVYGVDYPASNVRWSLIEASSGKIGSPVDKILLMCFHYDPSTGRYSFAIMNIVRLSGMLVLFGLVTYVVANLRRERVVDEQPRTNGSVDLARTE